ncbi:phosphodiester glycosidase family protein [Candidatus Sumerlaeota bacterium]|nr:phosphodiester glycosidase family protein [Candidatus Sumerlaeota bacterium]
MKKYLCAILFSILVFPAFPSEPVKWDAQRRISPSIQYQSSLEQRQNVTHQIHRIRIDLRGVDVTLEVVGSEGFPERPELPSDIMKRRKGQVVVPASLFHKKENNRNLPLGNLRTASGVFTTGHSYPEVRLRALNYIEFNESDDNVEKTPRIVTEQGETISTIGMNMRPRHPGYHLFTSAFQGLKMEEMKSWGIQRYYILAPVPGSSEGNRYWVDKTGEESSDIAIQRDACVLALVGAKQDEEAILKRLDRVTIAMPDETPGQALPGRFCGGPYFLQKGAYQEDSMRTFCEKEGAPSLSHYEQPKARLALGIRDKGRFLDIYCVDQKGTEWQGVTLREFAEFLIRDGIEDAIALPDGDAASVILGDSRINSTPSGIEYPVFTAFCVSERAPEPGERINLMRQAPNRIAACGSGKRNSPSAIKDGSIGMTANLDNYWEHISDDASHRHGISIDFYKSYQMAGVELFYAEEAGFSPQFNVRSVIISGGEGDKNSMNEMARVKNPEGYSHQYIPFPRNTSLRYLGIEIEQPGSYPGIQTARLAEIIVWGIVE